MGDWNLPVGHTGISGDRHGKFRARVKINGKERYLGPFNTRKEARIAETEFKIKKLQAYLEDLKRNRISATTAPMFKTDCPLSEEAAVELMSA